MSQYELELEHGEEAPSGPCGSWLVIRGKTGEVALILPSVPRWMEFPLDTSCGKLVPSVALPLLSDVREAEGPKGTHLGVCAGLETRPGFPLWGTALRPA